MALKISVVVVSRDRGELLSKCIDKLMNQSIRKSDYEIIIVDDGSQKDDLEAIVLRKAKKFRNLKIVRQKPSGLSAGRNLGAHTAYSPIVAYTDNDCLATENWLEQILVKFSDKNVAGVEGKITTDPARKIFTNAPQNLEGGKFIGANSAFRKEIIKSVGGYDEKMNFWREDSEFAFRVLNIGKVVFAKNAVIYHPLRKDPPQSVLRYLSFIRNEWVCFFKHPGKYLKYIGNAFFVSDLLLSLAFWTIALLFIVGAVSDKYLAIFLFLGVNFCVFAALLSKNMLNFEKGAIAAANETLLFLAFNSLKYFGYLPHFVVGFFAALIFMVRK